MVIPPEVLLLYRLVFSILGFFIFPHEVENNKDEKKSITGEKEVGLRGLREEEGGWEGGTSFWE